MCMIGGGSIRKFLCLPKEARWPRHSSQAIDRRSKGSCKSSRQGKANSCIQGEREQGCKLDSADTLARSTLACLDYLLLKRVMQE